MSNTQNQYVDPSITINYISEWKKNIVGRNNNPVSQKVKIDNRIKDTYYFQIVNKNNQIVTIDDSYQYEFLGSFVDAKNQMHTLFYSDTYTISQSNVIAFKVNTFTSEYLYNVKRPKEIELTIKKKGLYDETIILRDSGIAYPCPAEPGQEPTPVVAGWGLYLNGYVLSLNKGIQGSISIGYNNSIYNGNDSDPCITIGKGLYGDANQVVVGKYNEPVSTAVFIVGNGTDYDDQHNALVIDEDGEIFGGIFYSNGTRLATVNDISGSTSYTAGDGIGISDQNVISLTATIPSAVSQLTNDSSFISGITVEVNDLNIDNFITYNTTQLKFGYAFYKNSTTDRITLDYSYVAGQLRNKGMATTGQIPTSASQLDDISAYYKDIIADSPLRIDTYSIADQSSGKVMQMWIDTNTLSHDLKESYGFATTGMIPLSTSQLTNDSGFITNSALDNYALTSQIPTSASQLTFNTGNKVMFNHDTTKHNNSWALSYNPLVNIYFTENRCDTSGTIIINPIDFNSYNLAVGQGFVIEHWIYFDDFNADEGATLKFEVATNEDFYLIGDLPQTVTAGKVYSFVRRVIKLSSYNWNEQISFTAEMD